MYRLKNSNGITLIALVITIIVMLILVAVTINMAVNGGLFGYAGNAAGQTKTARDEEQDYANVATGLTYEELIDKYAAKELIHFNIDNVGECTAEEGMTFRQWIDSKYNNTTVCIRGVQVKLDSTDSSHFSASPDDVIVDGWRYTWRK